MIIKKVIILIFIASQLILCQNLSYASNDFPGELINRSNLKKEGLWWFDQGGEKPFDYSKPTIIFIPGTVAFGDYATKWNVSEFINSGWNVAAFNWIDGNDPYGALSASWPRKSSESTRLREQICEQLLNKGYNYNEIRFVGYSWGIFPAAYAAKKVLDVVRSQHKKILITIDAIEPVPSNWPITDDDGLRKPGAQHVVDYMRYVAKNQVLPKRADLRLFMAVYCTNYEYYFHTSKSWSTHRSSDFIRVVAEPLNREGHLRDIFYSTWCDYLDTYVYHKITWHGNAPKLYLNRNYRPFETNTLLSRVDYVVMAAIRAIDIASAAQQMAEAFYQESLAEYYQTLPQVALTRAETAQKKVTEYVLAAEDAVVKANQTSRPELQQQAADLLNQALILKTQADELVNSVLQIKATNTDSL